MVTLNWVLADAPDVEPAQYRQGRPHAGRRQYENRRAPGECEQVIEHEMVKNTIVDDCVERTEYPEGDRKKQTVYTDDKLQKTVYFEESAGLAHLVDPLARQETAETEAAHEHGKHDTDRKGRAPDNRHDHPCPEDFINKPGDTGEEEKAENDRKQTGVAVCAFPGVGFFFVCSFSHISEDDSPCVHVTPPRTAGAFNIRREV